jgi:hypothetical protein
MIDRNGIVWLGSWNPTGDRTASYYFETFDLTGGDIQGIHDTVEISETGNEWVLDSSELVPGEDVTRVLSGVDGVEPSASPAAST